MAGLPGALKEEKAIKEKDEHLMEAQAEVVREHKLQTSVDSLRREMALMREEAA